MMQHEAGSNTEPLLYYTISHQYLSVNPLRHMHGLEIMSIIVTRALSPKAVSISNK